MAPLCEGPCWHDISSVTAVIQLWAHFDPSLAVEPVFAALQLTCVTPHVVGKLDVSITESTAIKNTLTVSLSSTIALPHCTTITLQRCQSDGVLVVSLSSSLPAAFTFDVLNSAVKQAPVSTAIFDEPQIAVRFSGFDGTSAPDGFMVIKPGSEMPIIRSEKDGISGTVIWNNNQTSLELVLVDGMHGGSDSVFYFTIVNPSFSHEAVDITLKMGVSTATPEQCARGAARRSYSMVSQLMCSDMTVPAGIPYAPAGDSCPMKVCTTSFLCKTITECSSIAGLMNTLTLELSTTVPMHGGSAITISGFTGVDMNQSFVKIETGDKCRSYVIPTDWINTKLRNFIDNLSSVLALFEVPFPAPLFVLVCPLIVNTLEFVQNRLNFASRLDPMARKSSSNLRTTVLAKTFLGIFRISLWILLLGCIQGSSARPDFDRSLEFDC